MEEIYTWKFRLNTAVEDDCWSSEIEVDVSKEEYDKLLKAKEKYGECNLASIDELSDMASELIDMFKDMEEADYKEENPKYKTGLVIEVDI